MPKVVHAYNCTKSDSAGYSPFYLYSGGHYVCRAVDLIFGPSPEEVSVTEYVGKWKFAVKEAHDIHWP